MDDADPRAQRYIAAVWRAVAKALASPLLTYKERQDMISAALLVETQLRVTAKLYQE